MLRTKLTRASRKTLAATGTLFTAAILVIVAGVVWSYLDRHAFFSDRVRRERCHRHLLRMAEGKDSYCAMHTLTNGAAIPPEDFVEFVKGGWESLTCPGSGTYSAGAVGVPPSCSAHGPAR
ncbi:MAG TPA: hypothetical protein VIH35_05855 [Kiritimatiellia bacterium]|jgi:hypothetical protein